MQPSPPGQSTCEQAGITVPLSHYKGLGYDLIEALEKRGVICTAVSRGDCQLGAGRVPALPETPLPPLPVPFELADPTQQRPPAPVVAGQIGLVRLKLLGRCVNLGWPRDNSLIWPHRWKVVVAQSDGCGGVGAEAGLVFGGKRTRTAGALAPRSGSGAAERQDT